MIPPRLAKEYDVQTRRRDDMQRKIARLNRRFSTAISQISPRLTTPALYGAPDVPAPVVLPGLPEELVARAELMHEGAMGEQVAFLEDALGTKLRPDMPAPAAAEEHYERPAEPEAEAAATDYPAEGDEVGAEAPAADEGDYAVGETEAAAAPEEAADPFAATPEEGHAEGEPAGEEWVDFGGHAGGGEAHEHK
jgi:hypothetical protein